MTLGRCAARGQLHPGHIVHPVGGLRRSIQSHPPNRPRQKRPLILHAPPGLAPVQLQKSLLHCVLGILHIAQQTISDAKHEPRLSFDDPRKLLFPLQRIIPTQVLAPPRFQTFKLRPYCWQVHLPSRRSCRRVTSARLHTLRPPPNTNCSSLFDSGYHLLLGTPRLQPWVSHMKPKSGLQPLGYVLLRVRTAPKHSSDTTKLRAFPPRATYAGCPTLRGFIAKGGKAEPGRPLPKSPPNSVKSPKPAKIQSPTTKTHKNKQLPPRK